MNKQAFIEMVKGIIGLVVWCLFLYLHPQMPEFWVYIPMFLAGIVYTVMIIKRKDYQMPEGFAPYYRRANIETAILTLFFAAVGFLSQTAFSHEVMTWGLWLAIIMYALLFFHGAALGFYYNQRFKKR